MNDDAYVDRIEADVAIVRSTYDREPFGFSHTLHQNDLFHLDEIRALAERHTADDYFVATSALTPATRFYDVGHGMLTPSEAIDDIAKSDYRIILKRPERYDRRYRHLLETLFSEVRSLRRWPIDERVVRLDGAILISSSNAITPLHFDPEVSFLFKVAGKKSYHLLDSKTMTEEELEAFYVRGKLDIGQVAFDRHRDAREFLFELGPGMGMHQPQNTPHWVQTHDSPTVSYVFSIETDRSRAHGRTRGFNHIQRQLGLRPATPGIRPHLDEWKSVSMRAAFGLRDALRPAIRALRKR